MNLKERGITVGDLLITLLIIISITFMIKAFQRNNKTSYNFGNYDIKVLKNI